MLKKNNNFIIKTFIRFLFVFILAFIISPKLTPQKIVSAASIEDQINALLRTSGSTSTVKYVAPVVDESLQPDISEISEIKQQVSVDVFPEVPAPDSTVDITVETYGFNSNGSLVKWIVNGKTIDQGVGLKKKTVSIGASGTQTEVTIEIYPPKGETVIKKLFFAPGDVDLLWEAQTYTPPFYKGKSAFTAESSVIFTAVPNLIENGSRLDPNKVVYKWRVNREVQGDKSGYGKKTFEYKGGIILRDALIDVEAYSPSSPNIKGKASALLSPQKTKVLFYEESPTAGVLTNKTLSNPYYLTKPEIKVVAYPLFFSTNNKNANLEYYWGVGTYSNQDPSNQNTITLRQNGKVEKGNTSIYLKVLQPKAILQTISTALGISYSQNKDSFVDTSTDFSQ